MESKEKSSEAGEYYLAAYLALYFPGFFHEKEYKKIISKISFGHKAILVAYSKLIYENVIVLNEGQVSIRNDITDIIHNEIRNLPILQQSYLLNRIVDSVKDYLKLSVYNDLICTYLNFLQNKTVSIDNEIQTAFYNFFAKESMQIQPIRKFLNLIKISSFINDEYKIAIISTLYTYNQNKEVISLYETIDNKKNIKNDVKIKVSSAYFMLNQKNEAKKILIELQEQAKEDSNLNTTIRIINLINNYETLKDKGEKRELINEFKELSETVKNIPNCTNLLLKISSSILPHNEAIELLSSNNLNEDIVQIYNNIGALYLSEGHKKYKIEAKNNSSLVKAKKYLSFAKTLCEERKTVSFYLELNLLTSSFFEEYRKKSLIKNYSKIYRKYKSLQKIADSIYFKSIVLCNMFVLEKLTSNNADELDKMEKELTNIYEMSSDFKIAEKIKAFLDFNPHNSDILPLWIITETHY